MVLKSRASMVPVKVRLVMVDNCPASIDFKFPAETSTLPYCVTSIVYEAIPVAEMVTVAVRMAIVGFADAVIVIVSLPVIPSEGLIVSHD
jgi:hypothetical protein